MLIKIYSDTISFIFKLLAFIQVEPNAIQVHNTCLLMIDSMRDIKHFQ